MRAEKVVVILWWERYAVYSFLLRVHRSAMATSSLYRSREGENFEDIQKARTHHGQGPIDLSAIGTYFGANVDWHA